MSRKNLFVFLAVVVCLFPSIIFCGITRVFDTQDDWNTCSLEHCDTLSIPGSVKILRIYDDEFSGDELNDFWTWEVGQYNGNDRGYYKIGNPTGIFSLITHPSPETPRPLTEWWGATDTAPKIYQQLDFNDDFEIETLVKGNSSSPNYEAYGLFLRHSSDNGVAAVYDNSQEGVKATAWKNASGEMSKNSIAFGSYPDEILFKLKKIDSTVEPYYKEAGGEWQPIDGYTINYDKAYFGIYHKHVSIRGSYGNFDYVRY